MRKYGRWFSSKILIESHKLTKFGIDINNLLGFECFDIDTDVNDKLLIQHN